MLGFILLVIPGHSQTVRWSGKFRTRWETDTTGTNNAQVLVGRVRAGAVLQRKGISLGMEFQGGLGKTGETHVPILHQAYIQWKTPNRLHTVTRFGRFEMALGSERLLAANAWTWEGQAFTGNRTRLDWGSGGRYEGFVLFPDVNGQITNKRLMEGVFLQLRPKQRVIFRREISEWLLLRETDQNTGLKRITGSGRLRWSVLGIVVEMEAGAQQGRLAGQPVRARYTSVNISAGMQRLPWLKRILYGEEFYSGDRPQTDVLEGFANPYGERHRYLGFMDRIGPFPDNRSGGIREKHVYLDFRVNSRLEMKLHGHEWKPDQGGSMLRREWDTTLGYQWRSVMQLTWGIFQFQPIPGRKTDRFFYSGIRVNL
ncbi:MAG: alginate export family protein [Fidelibacterota bacterium]